MLCLLLLAGGGFLYLKYRVLRAADFEPDVSKRKSFFDLTPEVVAKMQQEVKDGSKGLYRLQVDSLELSLFKENIDATAIRIAPDSNAIRSLRNGQKLPDDIFRIEAQRLHIDGLGINELINRRNIGLGVIRLEKPVVTMHHHPQPYNDSIRKNQQTPYQIVSQFVNRLSIDSLNILDGDFNSYGNLPKENQTFHHVTVTMADFLATATSQFDTSRILLAKHLSLSAASYELPGHDNDYDFSIDSLSIIAEDRLATAKKIALKPRGGRAAFVKRLKTQAEVYDVEIAEAKVYGLDWKHLLKTENLLAQKATVNGAKVRIYVDKSLPEYGGIKRDNFPQQMLMDCATIITVPDVRLHDVDIIYQEYNPDAKKQGTILFRGLNATVDHISNDPAEVRRHPVAHLKANTLFMGATPMRGSFAFELRRQRQGAFRVDMEMGRLDPALVNRFAEALGLVTFTSGEMQRGVVHISGDNNQVRGTVQAEYTDLRLAPLKYKKGRLKKAWFNTLVANVLVKNKNPRRNGDVRVSEFVLDRTDEANFFAFAWMGMKKGLLKTIGVPAKLGM